MLAMKIGSTKCKQAWSTRLREGDYLHNCEVWQRWYLHAGVQNSEI